MLLLLVPRVALARSDGAARLRDDVRHVARKAVVECLSCFAMCPRDHKKLHELVKREPAVSVAVDALEGEHDDALEELVQLQACTR